MFDNIPLDTHITKNTSDKSNVSDMISSVKVEETNPLKIGEAKRNAKQILDGCSIKRRNFKNGKK